MEETLKSEKKVKNLQHGLKRLVQKTYLGVYKKTKVSRVYKDPNQKECLSICSKIIDKEGTILLRTIYSSKKYIQNEEMGIIITIEGNTVNVVNHVYSYKVLMDDTSIEIISEKFEDQLEKRRIEMEKEIEKNINASLKSILKEIKSNDKEEK